MACTASGLHSLVGDNANDLQKHSKHCKASANQGELIKKHHVFLFSKQYVHRNGYPSRWPLLAEIGQVRSQGLKTLLFGS